MTINNSDETNLETSDSVLNFFNRIRELTPEEIERKKQEKAKELENKGFLPENAELNETMTSPQEAVEANPRRFIIEECIPACQELWSKNIYTFMVSDHLNEGQCWIEIIADSLSEENKDVLMQLSGDDVIKFSYHAGCVNFGVKCVGTKGQQELLELAKQFKMQDVPKNQAWIDEEDFLMNYCNCFDEYDNPNYKSMPAPWEANIELDQMAEYMKKYEQWESSDESKEKLRRYNPNKATKSTLEYADDRGMIFEDGRVYLNQFHYIKHRMYLQYVYNMSEIEKALRSMK